MEVNKLNVTVPGISEIVQNVSRNKGEERGLVSRAAAGNRA